MTKKINQMAVRFRSLADGDGIAFKWESSLDKILTAGNYAVEIEHYGADVGLPIEDCGTVHSIVGTLVVTDSGALGNKQGDRVIGQVLTFTLRESKETSIYTRTYAGGEWSEWCSLARTGMYDEITNADELYSTVTTLAGATKELEENLHASIINYNEWKGSNAELSLPNVLADDEFVKMVKSGTLLTFKNTSTTWKRFQYTAASIAAADVKNYSNWKELSGAVYGIKQVVDAGKVQISTTNENGGEKDILNIMAATAERAGVMSAEDKRQISRINAEILDKKLHLQEAGYYESGGYISTINAKNTGLVYFKEYSSVICTSNLARDAFLVAFFDADCKLLKDISVKAGTAGWKTDVIDLTEDKYENAEYLAVSCYDATGSFAQFDALLYNDNSLETRVSKVEDKTNFELADIIEKQILLTDIGYYDMAGNKVETSKAMNTGFVSIDGYKKIEYDTVLSSIGAEVGFYDKKKAFIKDLSISGAGGWRIKTIDLTEEKYSNVGYVIISCYDSTEKFERFSAYLFNDNTLEFRIRDIEKLKSIIPSSNRPLNILIFGDSITDNSTISTNEQVQTTSYKALEKGGNYTDESGTIVYFSMWPYLMTSYIPCYDIRNYAKSGASFREITRSEGNERQNLSYQVQLALNDVSNPNEVFPTNGNYVPDVVIFALGTNDNTPTGSFEEAMAKTVMSADGKSFDVDATLANLDITITCDAIRYAFLKIKQAFPQSLCLCVLPIQRADSEQPKINEVLEQMARRYSIKVVDGAAELGVVRELEVGSGLGANLKDGLHPNDKGQKLYTRMVVNAIKNNWIEL